MQNREGLKSEQGAEVQIAYEALEVKPKFLIQYFPRDCFSVLNNLSTQNS